MNLDELRKAKAKANKDILTILSDLEQEFGVSISSVDTSSVEIRDIRMTCGIQKVDSIDININLNM